MDEILLIIVLLAMTVMLLVWSLGVFSDTGGAERKKLQQRLAGENPITDAGQAFTAVRREVKLDGFSGILVRLPGMGALYGSLQQTWPGLSFGMFLGISAGLGVAALLLVGGIFFSLMLGLAAGVVAAALPFMALSSRRNKRRQLMAEELPEALDFLGRILRAGHSLSTGLQMVGQELPEPLAGEFRRAYDNHSLGVSLEDALKEAATRVPSTDFGFFVTAVLIQRQTGGDMAEVLDNISDMIRGRLRLQQHVKAKTAEGRFSGYILTAFPVIMFFLSYALNPSYASVLLEGQGLYLLGAAGGLCLLGLFVIRKITQVRV